MRKMQLHIHIYIYIYNIKGMEKLFNIKYETIRLIKKNHIYNFIKASRANIFLLKTPLE